MRLRIKYDDDQVGAKLEKNLARQVARARTAFRRTASDAASEIESRGRADIAKAGHFGARWTSGLHARVSEGGGNIVVNLSHDIFYWVVHQFGAVIKGKPWLAIPLSFAKDAQGIRARDFPGGLFRVDRKSGAPLLLSRRDRQPKYFLRQQVRIPKRFHIIEIARDVAKNLRVMYAKNFRQG